MATDAETLSTATPDTSRLLARIVVGVDGSTAGVEATRQAATLLESGGALTLLGAWSVPPPTVGFVTPGAAFDLDEQAFRREAEEAVAMAHAAVSQLLAPTIKVARGVAWDELVKEADRGRDGVIAVGSHGTGRLQGILIGSTSTEIVHNAPCSVLVARPADARFPRRVVVGVDGSPQSAAAFAIADRVSGRFGSELWPVVAHGGKGVDPERVAAIVEPRRHEDLPDDPVHALVAAAADADLVVVGSRGLHGVKALGSVSERVAHRAGCSVLIVRGPEPEP